MKNPYYDPDIVCKETGPGPDLLPLYVLAILIILGIAFGVI